MATFVSSSRATAAGRPPRNQAGVYAHKLMRAETAMGNAQLWADFQLLTNGQAVYLPGFVCGRGDFDLMQALTRDLTAEMTAGTRGQGMVNWSQHFKHENPDFSPTFRGIVQRLAVSVPPPMLVSPLQHACVPPLCAERPNRCRQGLGNRQENLPSPTFPVSPFSPLCHPLWQVWLLSRISQFLWLPGRNRCFQKTIRCGSHSACFDSAALSGGWGVFFRTTLTLTSTPRG